MVHCGAGIGCANRLRRVVMNLALFPNTGALHGIRVLDLSRILGGPLCGQIMGNHGELTYSKSNPRKATTHATGDHPFRMMSPPTIWG